MALPPSPTGNTPLAAFPPDLALSTLEFERQQHQRSLAYLVEGPENASVTSLQSQLDQFSIGEFGGPVAMQQGVEELHIQADSASVSSIRLSAASLSSDSSFREVVPSSQLIAETAGYKHDIDTFMAAVHQLTTRLGNGMVTAVELHHSTLISHLLGFVSMATPLHISLDQAEQMQDNQLAATLRLLQHLLCSSKHSSMSVLTLPLAQHLTALAAHSGAINIAQAAARVLYWAVRRQAKLRSALSATRCSLNLLGRLQFVNAASLLASLAAVLTSLAGESVGSKIMLKHNILRACSQALARLLESLSQEDGQEACFQVLCLSSTLVWNNDLAIAQCIAQGMPEALLALIRQHQVSQRLAAPSLAILRHLVQAGTAQGQYCLQAGLLPGLLTLLARDDLPWASALALGVLRDVWPLLFNNPEHASGFVQACKLILQRFEDPGTWPNTLSLLLSLAQHHAFKQALRRLRFAPLVATCLTRMQRAPNRLELELLTTLSQSSQLDVTVLAIILALCSSQQDEGLQLSAASQLCELCLEPANQSVLCHSGGVSHLVTLLQDQSMPKAVVLFLASSIDATLECQEASAPFQEAQGVDIILSLVARFEQCLEVIEVVAHIFWHLTLVSDDISPSATSAMVGFLTTTLHTLCKCNVHPDLHARLICTVVGALRQLAVHDHLLMVLRTSVPIALLELLNEGDTLALAQDAMYLLTRLMQDTLVARQLGQRGVVTWLTMVAKSNQVPLDVAEQAKAAVDYVKTVVEAERVVI